VRVRLARAEDDAAIARLLATAPMDGPVQVVLSCGDSFFRALEIEGEDAVTCVAEHEGRIVGVGSGVARDAYVSGRPARVRYLGSLRLAPSARGTRALPRGFALLRSALADRGDELQLTTILDGNGPARRTLAAARAGLPPYRPVASLITYLVPTGRRLTRFGHPVQRADNAEELADFLNRVGSRRDLFPVVRSSDFTGPGGRFPGLGLADVFVRREGGRLVGALACWDTRARRQVRIAGYQGALRWLRPLADRAGRCLGWGGLPPPGRELALCFGALGVVAGSAVEHFGDLLAAVAAESATRGGAWLALTLDARDPLCGVCAGLRARRQRSTLYQVGGSVGGLSAWEGPGPLHLEAALL